MANVAAHKIPDPTVKLMPCYVARCAAEALHPELWRGLVSGPNYFYQPQELKKEA